jgi:alpha-L-fucosidase
MHRRRFLASAGVLGAGIALGRRHHGEGRVRWPAARPVPTAAQLRWQREELALFVHFGVNTFTDREWGDGTEDPRIFVPERFDAAAWARIARAAGFGSIVLTAKHHDGFCLWPSRLTSHGVQTSPWRQGRGDVVGDLARACREAGLGLGLYLSPWDRHEPSYGDSARYMDFYIGQLEELLSRYGPLAEVWFDGANGEGPNGRRQAYDWPRIHATVRRLQPGAVIFSDAGPDIRWIGNERGVAGETCWSTMDPAAVPYAGYDAPGVGELLQRGDPNGSVWRPGETDVSIRPGWFWHPAEDERVRSAEGLLDLYFTSVGRNSKLLLNVPPMRDGTWHANDVRSLEGFARRRAEVFGRDLCRGARVTTGDGGDGRPGAAVDGHAETFWSAAPGAQRAVLEVRLPRPHRANVVGLAEPIAHGQAIERFTVDVVAGGAWRTVASGTTVGHARLARFDTATVDRLRVTIESSLDVPRLSRVSSFFDEARA